METFSSLTYKERVSYVLCIGAFIMGFALSIAGFCVPPTGEISGSLLTWFGMVEAFVGSVLGISTHYGVELAKIKQAVEQGSRATSN